MKTCCQACDLQPGDIVDEATYAKINCALVIAQYKDPAGGYGDYSILVTFITANGDFARIAFRAERLLMVYRN